MEQWLDLIAKTGGVAMFLIAVGYGVMRVVDRDAGYKDVIRLYEKDNARLREDNDQETERANRYRAQNDLLIAKLEKHGEHIEPLRFDDSTEGVEVTEDTSEDFSG